MEKSMLQSISLRDFVAAMVLPEVIATERWHMDKDRTPGSLWQVRNEVFINIAYELADEFMKIKEKRRKK